MTIPRKAAASLSAVVAIALAGTLIAESSFGRGAASGHHATPAQKSRSRARRTTDAGAVTNLVLTTSGALGAHTRSVTLHLYDALTHRPIGSICLHDNDVSHVALHAQPRAAVYVGASENRKGCLHLSRRVRRHERRGKPLPDRRYVPTCYRLQRGDLDIIRYPEEFVASGAPKC